MCVCECVCVCECECVCVCVCDVLPPPPPPHPPTDGIAPRGSGKNLTTTSILDENPGKLEAVVSKGEGRTTLRLKKNGQAVVEEVV